MLRQESVRQLLEVLELTRLARSRGVPLEQAYQDAIRDVSNRYKVRYQTIGDLCRRRLGLRDIDQFVELLRRWLGVGDGGPLKRAIRQNADHEAHRLIEAYFASPKKGFPSHGPALGATHPMRGVHSQKLADQLTSLRIGNTIPLHLEITSELDRRLHLAQLAGLGSTKEAAAVALLEQGIAANRERIISVVEGL